MEYKVIYASRTGNTQKVAMKIFSALPGMSKDVQRVEEISGEEADTYFVGFWNDRGTCSKEIMDFMGGIHEKRVALFGTCGMGQSEEYFTRVGNQVAALIPDDNEYLGCFLCAGKMSPSVLEKYKRIQAQEDTPMIRTMISAYEEAMLHPNGEDFGRAVEFVNKILGK